MVSVIVPAYNAAATIERCLASVQAQSCPDWELLVVDDASTDDTVQKIAAQAATDSRIRLLRNTANSGMPAVPRNLGIAEARGRFLAFLDADDTWEPAKLQVQIAAMKDSGEAISCTAYSVVDRQGNFLGSLVPPPLVDYAALLRANTLGCSTVVYDVEALGKCYFPEVGHEDYALWLSLTARGHRVLGVQAPLARYQKASGSVSANKFRVLGYFWRIYRDRGFSPPAAFWLTLRYAWCARDKYGKRGVENE